MAAGRSSCRPTSTCPTSSAWRPRSPPRPTWASARSWTRCPATPAATPLKLAELSRRTGVHVIAPTGLHHDRYYGPAHWRHRLSVDELADLFVADVVEGIDANDYSGPVVHRTAHRAGVIKVAGSAGGPSDVDRPAFEAAAQAHVRTGAPILTHCEAGTGGLEQVRLLVDHGVDPAPRRPEPRRQGRRSRLSPRAGRDRRGQRVRRLVPLGRRARTARSSSSSGRPRTARSTRSSSGWTPRGRATTPCTVVGPG